MRLLNWNLERGGATFAVRDAQQELINEAATDIAPVADLIEVPSSG